MSGPTVCRSCGAQEVVPILWGMPASPDDLRRTDVVFGGCTWTGADQVCRQCGAEYADGAPWPPVDLGK